MRALLCALALAALGACAATPFAYHSQNEIPRGPGMITGEAGAFTLGPRTVDVPDRESEEYREFLEWKRRRGGETSPN